MSTIKFVNKRLLSYYSDKTILLLKFYIVFMIKLSDKFRELLLILQIYNVRKHTLNNIEPDKNHQYITLIYNML